MTRALYETTRRCFSLVLFVLASLALAAPVAAQNETTGAFQGDVTDASTGAPVAGATVQFTYTVNGVQTAKITDDKGHFYQGLLGPGGYTIKVTKTGYKTQEVPQVVFATQSNTVIPLPVKLEPESAVPTPTPTAQATPGPTPAPRTAQPPGGGDDYRVSINTTDGRRGGAFTDKEVSTLPLGATTLTRTFDELALLLPGVALPPQTLGNIAGPGVGAGVGSSGQFSVNGLRSRANNFTVDGSDNNDEDIGVRRQGFLSLVPQPIESVQEYQVTTLLAPAQYGRNIGAQVNAISKSGGNELHGIFFGYGNTREMNSHDFFDTVGGSDDQFQLRSGPATNRPVFLNGRPLLVRNQTAGEDSFSLLFGGFAVGGPIMKNRAYFFVSGEGQHLNATQEKSFAVPTVEQRGAFRSGATGISVNPLNNIPTATFPTTVGGDAIFSFFPFPNNPGGIYGANTLTRVLPANARGAVFSAKVDTNFRAFNRQSSFTARYNITDDDRDIPVTGGALFSTLHPDVRTQNISTFLNTELSNPNSTRPLYNQLRLSYGRTRLFFTEVRDQEFLRPVRRNFANPQDAQFLLNTQFIVNNTLPFPTLVCPVGACYDTFGTGETETQNLGRNPPGLLGPLGPIGQINIAGFSPVGVDVFNFPQSRINNTYQAADTMTLRLGRHNFAFGTDIRRTELHSDLPRNSRPLVTFNGSPRIVCANAACTDIDFAVNVPGTPNPFIRPEDFAAAGAPGGFFQSLVLPGRDSSINLRYYQLNFFIQDEWRVRPGFTLSYGLRYEYNTPPREVGSKIESTFNDPALNNPLVSGFRNFIEGRTKIFDPDHNNFAPRVGLAWEPFGNDKTVIRAGYGLFYDQILGAVVSQSRNVFPTFTTINFGGGCCTLASTATDRGFNIFNPLQTSYFVQALGRFVPIIQPGTLNTLNPELPQDVLLSTTFRFFPSFQGTPFGATLPDRQLESPMAHHYSVTYEQRLGWNFAFSAAYVGTQGRNLLRFSTPNLGPNYLIVPIVFSPFGSSFGGGTFSGITLDPGSLTPTAELAQGRPVRTIGPINIFETTAESRYDALQLQLRGRYRLFGSTQFQVNYTLSKTEDDVSDVFDLAGAAALPQNSRTLAGERGPANFDARHRFSYNFVMDLPSPAADHSGFVKFLFSGIQFAGTGMFQTGQPFTVNSIFDVNLDGNLTDRLNTTEGIIVTGDRQQPLRLTNTDPAFLASLLARPGQDGSVGRNTFRAGNVWLTNFTIVKKFFFSERDNLEFRVDIFNAFNRANFGIPVRFLEAPGFGQATDTVTPGRRIQFALKYVF